MRHVCVNVDVKGEGIVLEWAARGFVTFVNMYKLFSLQ